MGKMQFNALVQDIPSSMVPRNELGVKILEPIPKPFILSALSGCTGMDVISLLRKEEKQLQDFNIKVSGEISKQIPIEYIRHSRVYEM
jgi:putative redox protein